MKREDYIQIHLKIFLTSAHIFTSSISSFSRFCIIDKKTWSKVCFSMCFQLLGPPLVIYLLNYNAQGYQLCVCGVRCPQDPVFTWTEQEVKSSLSQQIELGADVIWNISSYWTLADWMVTGADCSFLLCPLQCLLNLLLVFWDSDTEDRVKR